MNQIKLKHVLAYLPYGVKVRVGITGTAILTLDRNNSAEISLEVFLSNPAYKLLLKPIPRISEDSKIPLDEITKGALEFMFESSKLPQNSDNLVCEAMRYEDVQVLLAHDYDIFGLISKGQALDIQEFNNEV